MLPYPSFGDPRHPGSTYSFNGIPVPADFFMLQLDIATHSEFGIAEALNKAPLMTIITIGYGKVLLMMENGSPATYLSRPRGLG